MIRIRNNDGTTVELPKGRFVEIVSENDEVALVFYQAQPNMVMQIQPGGIDAQRYENLFKEQGVKFNTKLLQQKI